MAKNKDVLWTDLVGNLHQGPKGPQWVIRENHLHNWSLQIYKRYKEGGYLLIFLYKVDNTWIPNPVNPITNAQVGARERLDVTVTEGVEQRVLSIDCNKHIFDITPFNNSLVSLPSTEKEEIDRVMKAGISKKAINFVLETLEDLNRREAAEFEALKKQKSARSKAGEGSNTGRTQKSKTGPRKVAEVPVDTAETERLNEGHMVPYTEREAEETTHAKNKKPKRALSPDKKTKKKKPRADLDSGDNPLVLTATEKGRVIAQGEEPSLEEAAQDRKKFMQLFGHIFPFGAETIFNVHIKRMKSAKAYQVTRPLDPNGVNLMKNYLIQTPPGWPQHNLCIMPRLAKGETWREGTTWDDIKDKTFSIINGQHTVAASQDIIAHRDTDPALKEKLKVWPCTIVWTDDPSMTVRLSYTLNNSNSFNKFIPTWTTQIVYCRRVWVKLNRPQKLRVNASGSSSDPEKSIAWKVSAPTNHRWYPCQFL